MSGSTGRGQGRRQGRAGHDPRHRGARRRLEGRRLVRAQRPARASPTTRATRILAIARRARLVSEPRGPRALGRARRRVRARARPAGAHARARAVLHGVPRRRRVRALGALDRAHDPARRRTSRRRSRSTGAGGASTASTACSWSTCASTTRASTSSCGSACRPSWSAARSKTAHLPAVWHDEAAVIVEAVQYLAALGHTRIAQRHRRRRLRPHGAADRPRSSAPRASSGSTARSSQTDYSAEQGARATRRLLSAPEPPTAIVFDSDLLAVTGLGVAQQMGFAVPDDLSIVGWDDSLISQVVHPPLTAITRDIEAFGDRRDAAPARRDRRRARPRTSRRSAASSRRAAAPPACAARPADRRRRERLREITLDT